MTPLLAVRDLKVHFPIRGGVFYREIARVHAVDGVDFTMQAGETLGVVGESGCGKSTVGRAILQIHRPTAGEVEFDGHLLHKMTQRQLRPLRKNLQTIFQDPYESLNPRLSIEEILLESFIIHKELDVPKRSKRVAELLDIVGLPKGAAKRYPHEFSGGQRQRVGIARAISQNPKLIICDEPVSALDVSIQSQIINLLLLLQKELKMAYFFISHDLSVVHHISDRVAVMYLGQIVEVMAAEDIKSDCRHPYTMALSSAIPLPDPDAKKDRILLKGDVPSPIHPPSGCRFHTRCPFADETCKTIVPKLEPGVSKDHLIACHHHQKIKSWPR